MKRVIYSLLISLCAFYANAIEITGEIGLEQRVFTDDAQFGPDYDSNVSAYFEPEFYHEWNGKKDTFTFTPYARVDEHDDERTHFDIRELTWVHVGDDWELRTGARIDFWGVTESQHLVDIVNQTDAVEGVDGEDKLGQPMINLSLTRDWGVLDLYALIGFRERTFAGEDGRIRGPLEINTDDPIYEHADEDRHVDVAIRWKHYYGPLDIAVSHFSGTSREPRLALSTAPSLIPPGVPFAGATTHQLVPIYDQIDQTGLEMQLILGGWAWKFEGITRHGQCWSSTAFLPNVEFCDDTFSAGTFGFEYTQTGVFDTWMDLGWVVEGLFDDRGDDAPAGVNEHDVLLAQRWTLNDSASTEALVGVIWDYETEERAFSVEASRRFSDNIKVSVEGRWFSNSGDQTVNGLILVPNADEKLAVFADKDFVQANFSYFF